MLHSISELDFKVVQEFVHCFNELDAEGEDGEGKNGTLEEEDFSSKGEQAMVIWQHLKTFDIDNDGYVELPEFIKGMGKMAMSKVAEFKQEWGENIPIGWFIYGKGMSRTEQSTEDEDLGRTTLMSHIHDTAHTLYVDLCTAAGIHSRDNQGHWG